MPVTIESIRTAIQAIKDTSAIGSVSESQWDQISTATAEMLIACTIDPTDKSAIKGFLCGSYAALNHIMNSPFTSGIALPFTFIQTELAMRWLDGTIQTISIADMLGLKETLDFDTPVCEVEVELPTGERSKTCTLNLGHDGHHCATASVNVDGKTYTFEIRS